MWGDISIAFLLALIATFMVTPYSIKLAKKIGAVDIPKDDRRVHNKLWYWKYIEGKTRGLVFKRIIVVETVEY